MEIFEVFSRSPVSTIVVLLGAICLGLAIGKKKLAVLLIPALIAFILYTLGSFSEGSIVLLDFFLFLLGGVLLSMEFLVPGFGAFGITGIIVLGASFYFSKSALETRLTSLALALVFSAIFLTFLVRKGLAEKGSRALILNKNIDEEKEDLSYLLGQEGRTLSPMRPSGKVRIENENYHALTDGSFIKAGEKVKVCKVNGKKIFVEKI